MKAEFWGVRGSIPVADPGALRYGGNTSCVTVRLGDGSLVVLDAGTGIRAAHAAGMTVIAVPNREYRPAPSALALAHLELRSLELLTVQSVEQAAAYKAG